MKCPRKLFLLTRTSAVTEKTSMWSIPPPFSSLIAGNLSQQQQRQQMRGIIRTPMSTNPNESARHVSYDGGHESMLANTPPTRKNLPSLEKLPAWMPATKHRHAVTGCAPNGLRLFSPPPSLLLSSRMKKSRDAQLTRKLEGLKSEITSFENTHLRRATDNATSHKSFGGQASGVDSLENISLAHGRMMSDLREMEQVVTKRCQSRWEPGLGRRRRGGIKNSKGKKLPPIMNSANLPVATFIPSEVPLMPENM